jgi:peroxiredoxin
VAEDASRIGEGEARFPKAAIAAIVVVVVAVVAIVVLGQRHKYEPVAAGSAAPDFTLPDLNGRAVSLKDFRGKVVFLNFWATWCKPCEEEMPSMQSLHDALKGQPFEIVAVSVDSEGPEKVAEFVNRYGLRFPVLHDRKGRVKDQYKTTGVPETFIVDQNGVIAEKVWGPRDWGRQSSSAVILDLLRNGPGAGDGYRVRERS